MIQLIDFIQRDRIKAIFLILLVAIVYLPFIRNPLVFDDVPFFSNVSSFSDTPFAFGLRWFPYSSLGFTWVFFGENPAMYRVQNLLLHGVNVLLLWLLLRLWINLFISDNSREKFVNWGAWLGALVFACHPLAVYGVGYLIQRSIVMATLFTLVMQLAYLRGLIENKCSYLALAVAAYFFAVFSKEHSVMAPAILLPLTWLLRGRIRISPCMLLVTWLGFALVALLVVLSAKGVFGIAYEADAVDLFGQQVLPQGAYLMSVLTQAGLFFKYCLLMLVPDPAWMSVDMRETFLFSYREWSSWVGLTIFIGYGICAMICLFRGGRIALLGLALLYPWLYFLTEFSTIRIQESFVLYRSYLWLPGFMLIIVLLASVFSEKRIIITGLILTLLLVALSWNRLEVFSDNYRLWNDAVQLLHGEDRLGAQRIYYNRAQAYEAAKNWDAAINDYQKSLSIDSSHPQVFLALANAYYVAKRYTEALTILDKVILQDEKNAKTYYIKGFILNSLNDKKAALINMKKSCELGANTACLIVNMEQAKTH